MLRHLTILETSKAHTNTMACVSLFKVKKKKKSNMWAIILLAQIQGNKISRKLSAPVVNTLSVLVFLLNSYSTSYLSGILIGSSICKITSVSGYGGVPDINS